jgi:hypothetical protein
LILSVSKEKNYYICIAVRNSGFILKLKVNKLNMKRVKTKDLDPKKMMTKAEYARKNKITPAAVEKRVKAGTVSVVLIDGGEVIHL